MPLDAKLSFDKENSASCLAKHINKAFRHLDIPEGLDEALEDGCSEQLDDFMKQITKEATVLGR